MAAKDTCLFMNGCLTAVAAASVNDDDAEDTTAIVDLLASPCIRFCGGGNTAISETFDCQMQNKHTYSRIIYN